jgi:hypothetical protein
MSEGDEEWGRKKPPAGFSRVSTVGMAPGRDITCHGAFTGLTAAPGTGTGTGTQ